MSKALLNLDAPASVSDIQGRIIQQDFFSAGQYLPKAFVDLLIMDPPYNISKNYHGHLFKEKERGKYQDWFSSVLRLVKPLLKPAATISAP